MRVVDLRASRGRALLGGVPLDDAPDGRLWGLPQGLVAELADWARLAAVGAVMDQQGHDQQGHGVTDSSGRAVSRRGRRLAARVSVLLRVPVDYHDPVSGQVTALRAVTRVVRAPSVPPVPPAPPGPPTEAAPAPEPTPWGTGLTLAVLVGGLALLANLTLALPLVATLGVGGVLVDVLVLAGLTPALWLNRRAPTWRWAVHGTLTGLAAAVPVLLVTALQ